MSIATQAPTLANLPAPPPGKTGWPWTEQSTLFPATQPDGNPWPRLSVVTPSYNQGEFIEETIRSVLLQGYPNLEYIIIDGGSTDQTLDIIRRYQPWITHWVSERDRGQSHAINKGFERSTGAYLAWMNSDDLYMPNAIRTIFLEQTGFAVDFIFGCSYAGRSLHEKQLNCSPGIQQLELKQLLKAFYSIDFIIASQSVWLSRALFEQVGELREDLHYFMDMEWFVRIALKQPKVLKIDRGTCFYRLHEQAKTSTFRDQGTQEVLAIVKDYIAHLPIADQQKLRNLIGYFNLYESYRLELKDRRFWGLINDVMQFPHETLSDRRFLGLIKQQMQTQTHQWIHKLFALKQRVQTQGLASTIAQRVRGRAKTVSWQVLDLQWTLKSGLTIQIKNQAEWVIYNDIFVDKEYDYPIQQAIQTCRGDRPLHILDLGANVGFFTLRVLDLLLSEYLDKHDYSLLLVEGSPTVYQQLCNRVEQIADPQHLKLVHGLVGKKSGSDRIVESEFHVMNSVNSTADQGTPVPYIDLESLYPDQPEIDLLKCDIEGSELTLIETYPELLKRVNHAVFEFHHDRCDTARCHDLLNAAGFKHHTCLRNCTTYSLEYFWK